MKTCSWVGDDPVMIEYHDREWGVPMREPEQLFEALLLEGAQAGLSWRTILNKREGYRDAFYRFSPTRMASMNEAEQEQLRHNPAIVRHAGKIAAFVHNAQAYLDMLARGESFSEFVWQFVDHQTVQNRWQKLEQIPAQTEASVAMSKALKKAGFKFVGPTTCYAFMQSAGLVNDHLTSCPKHGELLAWH